MSHVRLLALDLDGTTIDQRLEFSPAVAAAVQAAQDAGIIVTLATGRMVRATRPFAAQLGITAPLICYQGSRVQASDDTVLFDQVLAPALAVEVVELAQREQLYIHAYVDDTLWVARRSPELDEYLRYSPVAVPVREVGDLAAALREHPPTKLLWIAEPARLETLLPAWTAHFGQRLTILRSHEYFGEAASAEASKGRALALLAARLDIPREQVAAIGDRQNDASMLEWAGLGLAMGGADDYARAAADHILPTFADDGAAWGIRHYLLGVEADPG